MTEDRALEIAESLAHRQRLIGSTAAERAEAAEAATILARIRANRVIEID